MKTPESSKKAVSYPVKIFYWNGFPQIRPDGGNEEELYSFLSQFKENTKLNITLSEEGINEIEKISYQEGYEQAEKDIKEAIVKYFKYKQDHSPEHTLHWWVYKNVIDKVNEL